MSYGFVQNPLQFVENTNILRGVRNNRSLK